MKLLEPRRMRLGLKGALVIFPVLASVCSYATDLAVLRNGNSIRHERREVIGSVTRLYLGDGASGYIEIPSEQIEHFEKDTDPGPSTSSNLATRKSSSPSQTQTPFVQPAPVVDRESVNLMVNGAGQRHQIDPDFINSVIRAESGFNNRAVSRKGAQGLMQLMPQTASELGVRNAFDANANVEGGTKYLRELLEKYNYDVPKALAAYNAGSRRVDQYHGVPPYFETRTYVAKIIRDYNRRKLAENPALAKRTANKAASKSNTPGRSASTRAPARNAVSKSSSATSSHAGEISHKKAAAPAESFPHGPESAAR